MSPWAPTRASLSGPARPPPRQSLRPPKKAPRGGRGTLRLAERRSHAQRERGTNSPRLTDALAGAARRRGRGGRSPPCPPAEVFPPVFPCCQQRVPTFPKARTARVPTQQKAPHLGGFPMCPERFRAPTVQTNHKAENLVRLESPIWLCKAKSRDAITTVLCVQSRGKRCVSRTRKPLKCRGLCAQGDSNSHGPNGPQGPQPCASTSSATGA